MFMSLMVVEQLRIQNVAKNAFVARRFEKRRFMT